MDQIEFAWGETMAVNWTVLRFHATLENSGTALLLLPSDGP